MVAANGVTARFLGAKGLSSIRRVVRSPERWPRIVELAARHGGSLPPAPNARALQQFLKTERATAPDDYADLSLSVIKLLGRGARTDRARWRTGRQLDPRPAVVAVVVDRQRRLARSRSARSLR